MLSYQFETQKFSGALRAHKYYIIIFWVRGGQCRSPLTIYIAKGCSIVGPVKSRCMRALTPQRKKGNTSSNQTKSMVNR